MTRITRFAFAASTVAIAVTMAVPSAIAAASSPLAISERLLRAGDLPGFDPPPLTRVVTLNTAADWARFSAPERADTEDVRLRATGFVAGARVHLVAHLPGRDAISMVVQFRTPKGAHADFAPTVRILTQTPGVTVGRFTVRNIPGSQGFTTTRPGGVGYDVVFVDGQFLYDVGAFSPDPNQPPSRSDLVTAAVRLYRRVHGHRAG